MLGRYVSGAFFGLVIGLIFAVVVAAVGQAISPDWEDFASKATIPVAAGGIALALLAAYWIIAEPTPTDPKPALIVMAATAVVALSAALQPSTVQQYCSYGAVSEEQLAGCIAHASRSYVESLDTDAARYARDDFGSCKANSGPYCSDRLWLYQWLGW